MSRRRDEGTVFSLCHPSQKTTEHPTRRDPEIFAISPTCSREIFALEPYTGLRDLPHSKQNALCRGVINPQNGHILCNRTSVRFGTRIADTLLNSRAMKAKRLRTRLRN